MLASKEKDPDGQQPPSVLDQVVAIRRESYDCAGLKFIANPRRAGFQRHLLAVRLNQLIESMSMGRVIVMALPGERNQVVFRSQSSNFLNTQSGSPSSLPIAA